MPITYSEQETIKMCEDLFADIGSFYNADAVNYRGRTSGTKRLYTEVVAETILKHIDKFKDDSNFPKLVRKGSYKADSHELLQHKDDEKSFEEHTAKNIYDIHKEDQKSPLAFIGDILDFQTPLKDAHNIAIDLLSRDDQNKRVIILEMKNPVCQDETMLRCVLERYTYLKMIDKDKLLENFGVPSDYTLCAAPLVFEGTRPYQDMQGDCEFLKKLMKELDITAYYIPKVDPKSDPGNQNEIRDQFKLNGKYSVKEFK